MDRTLTVWVGAEIIYLYGTVNGTAQTFTLAGEGAWQATVSRSGDDNYLLHLEAYSANGLEGTYDYTLYYGMMPCVTDRTGGYYNASDLNRVGHNVTYLAGLLGGYGYAVTVTGRTDWAVGEIPSKADMDAYLADVAALKAALCGSVPLPDGMSKLTAEGANNIERLLCEVERNINRMIASWHYCGELYAGEV